MSVDRRKLKHAFIEVECVGSRLDTFAIRVQGTTEKGRALQIDFELDMYQLVNLATKLWRVQRYKADAFANLLNSTKQALEGK